MYSQNDFRNYAQNDQLEHHGILGQKWGRQQGPPYPLDAGDHSAAEKKAGWRKSLDNDAKAAIRKTASTVKNVKTIASKDATSEERKAAGKDVARTTARVAGGGALGKFVGAVAVTAATPVAMLTGPAAPLVVGGAAIVGAYAGYKVGYAVTNKAIDVGAKAVAKVSNSKVASKVSNTASKAANATTNYVKDALKE